MRILIVEDDPGSRQILQHILSPYGHCDFAEDGLAAVAAFEQAHAENRPYELICLDLLMPHMNGQEALKRIREIETAKSIEGLSRVKIVITTALDSSENVLTAFREGCEAYFVKPYRKDKLLAELRKLGLVP